MRLSSDGEPWTAASTFTQLLSSGGRKTPTYLLNCRAHNRNEGAGDGGGVYCGKGNRS